MDLTTKDMKMDKSSLNRILLVCTMAAFATPFMGSSLNLAIPAIGRELEGNLVQLNWVVTSFLLASASLLLPFGRLADLSGRRRVFQWGLGLFAVSSLLCGLAPSIGVLLVFRCLQGMGGAMMFATGMAIVTASFPVHMRGRVLGINSATVYIGLALGPVLGGFLTHWLGWRSIFLLIGLLVLLLVFAARRWIPDDSRHLDIDHYDIIGAVLITLSLVLITYGSSNLTRSTAGPWILAVGIAGLFLFVWQEMKVPYPILDLKLVAGNRVFAFSNLAAFINYCATYAVNYLLSLYMQMVRGFNPQEAGSILLVQPVVMALISPLAGRLSDRISPRLLASTGMGVTAAGMAMLATVSVNTSINIIIVYLILLGLGFGLFASPNNNAVMSSVEKRFYGIASSTLGTMRLVGQAFSMAIVNFVFAHFLGYIKITPAMAKGLMTSNHIAFMIFAGLCILGIPASLARGKVHRGRSETPEKQEHGDKA